MLEPWASPQQEMRFAIGCYRSHKKYKCNACSKCPINIKFLHTPNTSTRELTYRMIQYAGERNKGVGVAIALWVAIIGVLVYLLFIY
jgi:hypothetical protein